MPIMSFIQSFMSLILKGVAPGLNCSWRSEEVIKQAENWGGRGDRMSCTMRHRDMKGGWERLCLIGIRLSSLDRLCSIGMLSATSLLLLSIIPTYKFEQASILLSESRSKASWRFCWSSNVHCRKPMYLGNSQKKTELCPIVELRTGMNTQLSVFTEFKVSRTISNLSIINEY